MPTLSEVSNIFSRLTTPGWCKFWKTKKRTPCHKRIPNFRHSSATIRTLVILEKFNKPEQNPIFLTLHNVPFTFIPALHTLQPEPRYISRHTTGRHLHILSTTIATKLNDVYLQSFRLHKMCPLTTQITPVLSSWKYISLIIPDLSPKSEQCDWLIHDLSPKSEQCDWLILDLSPKAEQCDWLRIWLKSKFKT